MDRAVLRLHVGVERKNLLVENLRMIMARVTKPAGETPTRLAV